MPRTLDDVTWPLRTQRLTIRRATTEDFEPTWLFRRLAEVSQWLTVDASDKEEYQARFESEGRLAKTLVVERDGAVIADLMVSVEDAWAQAEVADQAKGTQAELGWCFSPDHTGRGLATEAVAELVRLCFEDLGVRRVVANCFADNIPSWRLMERLGMRRELHAVQESLHRSGAWLDGLGYALLVDEWRGRVTVTGG